MAMTQKSLERMEAASTVAAEHSCRWFRCTLLVWITVLTIGLVADISLHYILKPREGETKSPPSQITFFDLVPSSKTTQKENVSPKRIEWENKEGVIADSSYLKIKDDGFYFLYGQVTLDSEYCNDKEYNDTVEIKKKKDQEEKGEETVLEGYLSKESCSTGFLGKILRLEANNVIIVECPVSTNLLRKDRNGFRSFMGIYKLANI